MINAESRHLVKCIFFAKFLLLMIHYFPGSHGGCIWGNNALEMIDTNPLYADFVALVFDEWE